MELVTTLAKDITGSSPSAARTLAFILLKSVIDKIAVVQGKCCSMGYVRLWSQPLWNRIYHSVPK